MRCPIFWQKCYRKSSHSEADFFHFERTNASALSGKTQNTEASSRQGPASVYGYAGDRPYCAFSESYFFFNLYLILLFYKLSNWSTLLVKKYYHWTCYAADWQG